MVKYGSNDASHFSTMTTSPALEDYSTILPLSLIGRYFTELSI